MGCMRIFSLKAAVIIWIFYGMSMALITGYITTYFGLYIGMYITGITPLPLIIYFLAYVWNWNRGEARFP